MNIKRKNNKIDKRQPPTNGLASCGVSARGKFCGNLKVCRPSELLCSPARTPSRQPLAAMRVTAHQTRKYKKTKIEAL